MAKWKITEEEPISEFRIGRTNLEIEGFNVVFEIYYVPKGYNVNLFRIYQSCCGETYNNYFSGTLQELLFRCCIADGVQPYSWKNVNHYLKKFYLKDKMSKFRYRKYIKMKRKFERLLNDIAHTQKYSNSFWKKALENKRKGGFKYIADHKTPEM